MKKYSFLIESKSNFDLNYLNNLSNIRDRIKYCDNSLEYIGHGVGKRVYKLDDTSVLKLAYNRKGLDQNKTEILISKYDYPFLAKVYNCEKRGKWIVAEYCYLNCDRDYGSTFQDFKNKIKQITRLDTVNLWFLCHVLVSGGIQYYNKSKDLFKKMCYELQDQNSIPFKKFKERSHSFWWDLLRNYYKVDNDMELCKNVGELHIAVSYAFHRGMKPSPKFNLDYCFKIIDSGKYKSIPFIKDLIRYPDVRNKIDLADCFNTANTGIVKRNGKDEIVILDYGWREK